MASIAESIYLALEIMAMGMILVFIFLSILIAGIKVVARLYAPTPIVPEFKHELPHSIPTVDSTNKKIAAITAAIHQYRKSA